MTHAGAHSTLSGKRIWVAGHRGMLGSALMRRLAGENPAELLHATREALDLRDPGAVLAWTRDTKPEIVFVPAGTVGGIRANLSYPADFLRDNTLISVNVIDAAFRAGAEKLVYVASSAVYPVDAAQPLTESALMTGPLEAAHAGYAFAKLAGIKMCETYRTQFGCDFISVLPTNLYGPGDSYDLENAHVVPALIRKAHEARLRGERDLEIWGSGASRRDFLHVDDCADGLVHLARRYSGETPVNVGSGADVRIAELAALVMETVGLDGALVCDRSRPDGAPRRLLDTGTLQALGWHPSIGLREGLASAYRDFCARYGQA